VSPGSEAAAVGAAHERGSPRAFHRLWSPLWIVFVGYQWWIELGRQLAGSLPADAPMAHSQAAAVLGAVGHLAGNAIEALFYVAWWRARGTRLGFMRLFEWLVSISVLDLLGSGLTRVAQAHPGWVAGVLEVFVGFGALHRGEFGSGSGLEIAFGSVGLLCIARLVATAVIQRQCTSGRLATPLMLTTAVWLICRVVNWWLFDLARGMSPLS
jgi:hypothetical protein